VVRRTIRSVVLWWLVFGAAVAVLYWPDVAAWAVRIGGLLLAAYFARWLIGYGEHAYYGPRLFERPDSARLAVAAHEVSGVDVRECCRFSRRIRKKYDGDIALLGLITLEEAQYEGAKNFDVAWDAACAAGLEKAQLLALKYARKAGHDRPKAADVSFLVQAMCLCEEKTLDRLLAGMRLEGLGRHSARAAFGRRILSQGQMRPGARSLDLTDAAAQDEELGRVFRLPVKYLLFPALAFSDLGFRGRAIVIGVVELVLFSYALIGLAGALGAGNLSWRFLWNNSGGVFFAVWILVHVESLFAIGDFSRLSHYLKEMGISGERER